LPLQKRKSHKILLPKVYAFLTLDNLKPFRERIIIHHGEGEELLCRYIPIVAKIAECSSTGVGI